jgi:hypothetical protein
MRQTLRARSIGMWVMKRSGKSSGMVPASGRKPQKPHSVPNAIFSIFTSSMSPGSAPATGDDVARAARHFGMDLDEGGRHREAGVRRRQRVRAAADAFQHHAVPGFDGQHRRNFRVEHAPAHSLGRSGNVMQGHASGSVAEIR